MTGQFLTRDLVYRIRSTKTERTDYLPFTKKFLIPVKRSCLILGLAVIAVASGQVAPLMSETDRNTILREYVHVFRVVAQEGNVLRAERVFGDDGHDNIWRAQGGDGCRIFIGGGIGLEGTVRRHLEARHTASQVVELSGAEIGRSYLVGRWAGVTRWGDVLDRVRKRLEYPGKNPWERLEYCLSVLSHFSTKPYDFTQSAPGSRITPGKRRMIDGLQQRVEDELEKIQPSDEGSMQARWRQTEALVEDLKKFYPRSRALRGVEDRVNRHYRRGLLRIDNTTDLPLGVSIAASNFDDEFNVAAGKDESRHLDAGKTHWVRFESRRTHQPLEAVPVLATLYAGQRRRLIVREHRDSETGRVRVEIVNEADHGR